MLPRASRLRRLRVSRRAAPVPGAPMPRSRGLRCRRPEETEIKPLASAPGHRPPAVRRWRSVAPHRPAQAPSPPRAPRGTLSACACAGERRGPGRCLLLVALHGPADAPREGVELIKSAAEDPHSPAPLRVCVGSAVLEMGLLGTCDEIHHLYNIYRLHAYCCIQCSKQVYNRTPIGNSLHKHC